MAPPVTVPIIARTTAISMREYPAMPVAWGDVIWVVGVRGCGVSANLLHGCKQFHLQHLEREER
jgi:hypothetical protein